MISSDPTSTVKNSVAISYIEMLKEGLEMELEYFNTGIYDDTGFKIPFNAVKKFFTYPYVNNHQRQQHFRSLLHDLYKSKSKAALKQFVQEHISNFNHLFQHELSSASRSR